MNTCLDFGFRSECALPGRESIHSPMFLFRSWIKLWQQTTNTWDIFGKIYIFQNTRSLDCLNHYQSIKKIMSHTWKTKSIQTQVRLSSWHKCWTKPSKNVQTDQNPASHHQLSLFSLIRSNSAVINLNFSLCKNCFSVLVEFPLMSEFGVRQWKALRTGEKKRLPEKYEVNFFWRADTSEIWGGENDPRHDLFSVSFTLWPPSVCLKWFTAFLTDFKVFHQAAPCHTVQFFRMMHNIHLITFIKSSP